MKELIEKVLKMRELQKRYFKGERDSMTLQACKKAEREVDALLLGFGEAKKNIQTSMFN